MASVHLVGRRFGQIGFFSVANEFRSYVEHLLHVVRSHVQRLAARNLGLRLLQPVKREPLHSHADLRMAFPHVENALWSSKPGVLNQLTSFPSSSSFSSASDARVPFLVLLRLAIASSSGLKCVPIKTLISLYL